MPRRSRALIAAVLSLLPPLAGEVPAQLPLILQGGEFQVNTYTTDAQTHPSGAALGGGRFVVAWESLGSPAEDPSQSIRGRRYDAAGAPVGSDFQVNTYTTSYQRRPSVAADADGNFVVVWQSEGSSGSDTDGFSIQCRRYDAAGVPLGANFQVNTYTTGAQSVPRVASDATGNFVVVWQSDGSFWSDVSSSSVQAQRFTAAGTPLGAEFQVNTYTTGIQVIPHVASVDGGGFIVAWQSGGSAGSDTGSSSIQARRYDALGMPLSADFQVNTYTTSLQGAPRVAAIAAGSFVVVWHSYGSAGSDADGSSVQGQCYDASGATLGAEFQVNAYTTDIQRQPDLVDDGAGNAIVVWESIGGAASDTDDFSVQGRRFDAAGVPLSPEFQVNTYTTAGQSLPGVQGDATGNVLVVWASFGSTGSDTGSASVQAQRYAMGLPILGRKLLVRDPSGSENGRGVVAIGRETATDIGAAILGNPAVSGATLRVVTNGMVASDQTYVLDAAGWSPLGSTGFSYRGPTGVDADPVKRVLLKRTPGGTALLKAILKGNLGTQSLDVVPPNLGSDGGLVLGITGGGTYCVAFGAAAGGVERRNDGELWKVVNAAAEGCPAP
jgi:hypothetical protein